MRLTDEQLRDVLARAEEIQRKSLTGSAAEAEREAVIQAGEAIGLQRSAIERALRERPELAVYDAQPGELVFARSSDRKYYVAEVVSAGSDLVRVRFLRGSEHLVAPDELRPCAFLPGDRVVANWPYWGPWPASVVSYDANLMRVRVNDGWGSEIDVSIAEVWLAPAKESSGSRFRAKLLAWGAVGGVAVGTIATYILLRLFP